MYPLDNEEDDFPSYLRKRNIFDTPPSPNNWFRGNLFGQPTTLRGSTPDLPGPQSTGKATTDLASAYKSMMDMQAGPAQTQYRQFLNEQLPTPEKFKPSPISRIGAILSGLSTGITRGAGEGYATAQGILDQPYKQALENYKLQGGRLGEAARVENEDVLNKVKLTRDILESQDRQARETRQETLDKGRIANWESLAKSRGNWKFEGNSYVDLDTGIRYQNERNPTTGELRRVALGKTGRTTAEEIGLAAGKAGAAERARSPFVEAREGRAEKRARDLATFREDLRNERESSGTTSETQDIVDPKTGQVTSRTTTRKPFKIRTHDIKLPTEFNIGSIGQENTPSTVRVKLSDGRELNIPTEKLDEAKKRDPNLRVLISGQ